MRLKSLISCVLAASLTVALFAGSAVTASAAGASTKFTIVHTNDVHARVGVEPYVAELVKQKKAANENIILLSAGDVLHGQTIATLSQGKNIVDIMNAVGYDAMVPGNHDFNYGSDRLLELQKSMRFPLLAANVTKKLTGGNAFKPYIIKEIDGVKIGIFGLTTPETATKTNPNNVRTLDFRDGYSAARITAKELKDKGCNVVIALTHLGLDKETWYYNRSSAVATVPGIDVIIDGHSHTELPNGMTVGSALIAQTGANGDNIGMVEVEVVNGKVKTKTAMLLKTPTEENPIKGLPPEKKVSDLIAKLNIENEKITSEVVGYTPVYLDGEREHARMQQTNLGDLITDAMIDATGAQIAVTNGGGIRASIKAGNITKGDVLTVLPFGNYVVVKQVTGAQLKEALEHSVSAYPELSGGFLHVSGIKFTFDPGRKVGSRVTTLTLADGTPIDPNKSYSLATNDFLADGGDGYDVLNNGASEVAYSALDEVLIKYIQRYPSRISGAASNRITVTQAKNAA